MGRSEGLARFVVPMAMIVLMAAATAVGLELSLNTAGLAPNWIADGLLLSALLTVERNRLAATLAIGVVGAAPSFVGMSGFVGVSGFHPIALAHGAVIGTASMLTIGTAYLLLNGRGWRAQDLATPRGLAIGAAIVLGAAPLPGAILASFASNFLTGADFVTNLGHWLMTETLGLAIVAPLTLAMRRRDMLLLFVPPLLTTTLVLLLGYTAILALVFFQDVLPLLYLIFPPLLLLVGRLGFPGAGIGILLTALAAACGEFLGTGAISLVPNLGDFGRVTFMQFLLFVASIMAYPMGAVVAERRRMNQAIADKHAKLARNEKLYRLLADNASDMITRVRFDGRRVYVSPSVTNVLGWSVAEAMRPDWQTNCHPDDIPGFVAVRERLRENADAREVTNRYRFRRKDGSWAWLEARMHLVRNSDGKPHEFVAHSRDITQQKEAEQALEVAMEKLAEQVMTDGLTGVANRRRFDESFALEWRRSLRTGEPFCVLMIDADHFKGFNDRYGHQAGDDCLRAIATTIATNIRRAHDLVARYGGEEFVVILPATDLDGALVVGRQIRAAIEDMEITHEANADGVVTASIGVARAVPELSSRPESLIEAADAALYVAKRNGRNRVEVAHPDRGDAVVVPLLPHLRRSGDQPSTHASPDRRS